MKRYHSPKRRDRVSGKGSPYHKHNKTPYHYPFPIGAEGAKYRMEKRAKEAGHDEDNTLTPLADHIERKAKRRRSLERRRSDVRPEASQLAPIPQIEAAG